MLVLVLVVLRGEKLVPLGSSIQLKMSNLLLASCTSPEAEAEGETAGVRVSHAHCCRCGVQTSFSDFLLLSGSGTIHLKRLIYCTTKTVWCWCLLVNKTGLLVDSDGCGASTPDCHPQMV
jgi:hypothetical protein